MIKLGSCGVCLTLQCNYEQLAIREVTPCTRYIRPVASPCNGLTSVSSHAIATPSTFAPNLLPASFSAVSGCTRNVGKHCTKRSNRNCIEHTDLHAFRTASLQPPTSINATRVDSLPLGACQGRRFNHRCRFCTNQRRPLFSTFLFRACPQRRFSSSGLSAKDPTNRLLQEL